MVAELVDALASGVSVLKDVRVQVPPFAPHKICGSCYDLHVKSSKNYVDCQLDNRRVAQLGSATGLGPVGRRFESSLADQFQKKP